MYAERQIHNIQRKIKELDRHYNQGKPGMLLWRINGAERELCYVVPLIAGQVDEAAGGVKALAFDNGVAIGMTVAGACTKQGRALTYIWGDLATGAICENILGEAANLAQLRELDPRKLLTRN